MSEPAFDRRALDRASLLFGEEHARRRLTELWEWDPDFCRLFQDFVYGGMYSREALSSAHRELIAVAALVALRSPLAKPHMVAALKAGATMKEVLEVVLQMSVYAGLPATLSALPLLREAADTFEATRKAKQGGA
jgi:4-carboxymuconolactone decarboxylase